MFTLCWTHTILLQWCVERRRWTDGPTWIVLSLKWRQLCWYAQCPCWTHTILLRWCVERRRWTDGPTWIVLSLKWRQLCWSAQCPCLVQHIMFLCGIWSSSNQLTWLYLSRSTLCWIYLLCDQSVAKWIIHVDYDGVRSEDNEQMDRCGLYRVWNEDTCVYVRIAPVFMCIVFQAWSRASSKFTAYTKRSMQFTHYLMRESPKWLIAAPYFPCISTFECIPPVFPSTDSLHSPRRPRCFCWCVLREWCHPHM